jgi:hypothetical protein
MNESFFLHAEKILNELLSMNKCCICQKKVSYAISY